jgi:hypothetical protein
VRAELYRPDDPDTVVAIALWLNGRAHVDVREEIAGVDRLLRATPVVTNDASLRQPGSSGDVVLDPGSAAWFRAALATRAPELGLAVRFVAERITGGWDPAAAYTTFEEQVERLSSD